MSAGEIHKDDIGVVFEFTVKDQDGVVVDVSGASTKTFIFDKPDGTNVNKTASFGTDGTDGILTYTTVSGDLDQIGIWHHQAHVVIPSGDFHSDITEFRVYPNL
jgi:hypothetical protein